jgi:hypothetical protein
VIAPKPAPPNDERFIGGLLAIFIPLLIEKAIGSIAAALKKAGGEQTLKDTGRLPTYFYRLPKDPLSEDLQNKLQETRHKKGEKQSKLQFNPEFRCVIVVRGTFTETGTLTPARNNDDELRRKKLRDSNIFVDQIGAIYEGAVIFADDRTALRYEGRFFEVNKFQGSRSQDKKRGMVVSIAISGAGQKDGDPLLSLALVNLGEVKANDVLTAKDLETKSTSWLGGLAISEDAMKAIETLDFVDPNTGLSKPELEIMPVNVEAGFEETEDGNKALLFIGEVLDSAKTDVAKELSGDILDQKKKAEGKADALEKVREDEESAFADYLKAQMELAALDNPKPEEKRAKQFEVARTLRVWCVKQGVLKKLGIEKHRGVSCEGQ